MLMKKEKSESDKSESTGFTNVGVRNDVNDKLNSWCEKRHAVKREVVAAIVARFLTLPDSVQTAFVDTVDSEMRPAYAEMLEILARSLRSGPGPTRPDNPGPTRSK